MMNKIECRTFKMSVGWGEAMFFFPKKILFDEIKKNVRTFPLKKYNYIGTFEYDPIFLENIDSEEINNKKYYMFYYMTIER